MTTIAEYSKRILANGQVADKYLDQLDKLLANRKYNKNINKLTAKNQCWRIFYLMDTTLAVFVSKLENACQGQISANLFDITLTEGCISIAYKITGDMCTHTIYVGVEAYYIADQLYTDEDDDIIARLLNDFEWSWAIDEDIIDMGSLKKMYKDVVKIIGD